MIILRCLFLVSALSFLSACGGGSSGSASSEPVNSGGAPPVVNDVVEPPEVTPEAQSFSSLALADKQLYTELQARSLEADGQDRGLSAYDLIIGLGGARPIESPDLYEVNHPGEPHIYEALDPIVGEHFVFVIHRDDDADRDRTEITDRQRNEIKTYGGSEDAVKGFEDETMIYEWKFKINADMDVSRNFSHFFQLKAVGGNDSHPILTFTGNERSSEDGLEIRHAIEDDDDRLGRIEWNEVTGEWLEAYVRATFADEGALRIIVSRLSDGEILFDVNEANIDLWRGENDEDFVRPKWGIYRSLVDITNLRADEEDVRFANFSVTKVQ